MSDDGDDVGNVLALDRRMQNIEQQTEALAQQQRMVAAGFKSAVELGYEIALTQLEEHLLLLSDATRHHLAVLYRAQLHGGIPPELSGPEGKPWAWPTEDDTKPLEVGEGVTFRMNGALMSGEVTALIPHVGQIVVGFGTASGAKQFATIPVGDVKRAEV